MSETLYTVAARDMRHFISVYLDVAERTASLTNLTATAVRSLEARRIVLAGIGSPLSPESVSPREAVEEWKRRQAIPFDLERSITTGVYERLRTYASSLLADLEELTQRFSRFEAEVIRSRPGSFRSSSMLAESSARPLSSGGSGPCPTFRSQGLQRNGWQATWVRR